MAEWALIDKLIVGAMAAGGGMEAYGSIRGGQKAKKEAARAAFEAERRAEVARYQGFERQRELERDKQRAVGRVKGAAAKGGLRVSGSVKTLSERVAEDFERRKLFIGTETSEQVSALYGKAHDLRSQGRRSKKAGYWGAGKSLLSTGVSIGEFGYERGLWGTA